MKKYFKRRKRGRSAMKDEDNEKKMETKEKKPMSMKKKWAILVAMAVVFGLMAGGVMYGVNAAGNRLYAQSHISNTDTLSDTEEASSDSTGNDSASVEEVTKNAMPSLVTISTMSVEEMRNFFGGTQKYEVEGAGSGVIVGDSDDLELGEQVVAIGNALGYGQSVTCGYVSALDRDLTLTDESGATINSTGLIQTDAAINPGNSGGALLNMKGELIGINEAKTASTPDGSSVDNIGFAIPIDKAESSIKDLMNLPTREKVDESQASYLGIQGSSVTSDITQLYGIPEGVAVSEVVENRPADAAGIQKGDVITELDGRTISNIEQLQDTLQYYAAGETVKVTVERQENGSYQAEEVTVTLGSAEAENQ